MPTVKLVDENTTNPKIRAIFNDIKATKKIERIPNIWRALAANPDHLELCWQQVKAIMRPGKLDLMTKEIIAAAVSITNGCDYCINSHLASTRKGWPRFSPSSGFTTNSTSWCSACRSNPTCFRRLKVNRNFADFRKIALAS